jgi:cytochrome c556
VLADTGGASISDVMIVAHLGDTSLLGQLKEATKGSGPDSDKAWKAVKAQAAVLASLATEVLAKQSPSKGDAASWKKQVSGYAGHAVRLAAAAGKKDSPAVASAVKSLGQACAGCHKVHKGS